MTEINGHTYSAEKFPEYKIRAKIVLTGNGTHVVDVYTTQTFIPSILDDLRDQIQDYEASMDYWISREQDEKASKLIKEYLSN